MSEVAVLVLDNDGEGEVWDVFNSFEEAVKAGRELGREYTIYVREGAERD